MTYLDMIICAIKALKEHQNGSSIYSIKKYVRANFPNISGRNCYFRNAFDKGTQTLILKRTKMKYKLGELYKKNYLNK